MLRMGLVLVTLVCLVTGGKVMAQDVFAYPNQGQSKEQQDKDNYECYSWAKQQSNFDPMQVPTASSPPPREESTGPGMLGGAAGGAGLGAVGGLIAGDAGKGAAIGAISGGVLGGVRSRNQTKRNQEARQDWERQQAAQYQNARSQYNRAFSACMQARGYTIS